MLVNHQVAFRAWHGRCTPRGEMMLELRRLLPLPPVSSYPKGALPGDTMAAIAVVFLGVPQGMAYATIAELPPVMGLYASVLPAILGSIFRSSVHVVAGPTNALSLLVGGAVATGLGADPITVVVTLAAMVGVMQVLAGLLRLGAVVDFISSSVVLGYITGAGLLIGIGQLYNLVGTAGPRGRIWVTVGGWLKTLPDTAGIALAFSAGTVVLVHVLRRINRKIPGAVVALVLGIVVNLLLGAEDRGLKVVSDIGAITAGLPPLSLPDVGLVGTLVPLAFACTVLSLIESNALARSLAARSGQRLDASVEFVGQGLANLAAGFTTGYPVSGSLSRSALNQSAGATTRLAGTLSGLLMALVLLTLGDILNHTPVASLAGLLVVVAIDLVDLERIKSALKTGWPDRLAFLTTCLGTWTVDLDKAIYLGVAVSLVLYLRKARLLQVRELVVNEDGTLREVPYGQSIPDDTNRCPRIRMLQLEGSLFFAAAGELRSLFDEVIADEDLHTIIVRIRRTQGLDATTAAVFEDAAAKLRETDRRLILVGVADELKEVLEGSGAAEIIGAENLLPPGEHWFSSLGVALRTAIDHVGAHECARCPLHPDGDFDPEKSRPRLLNLRGS